MAKKENVGVYQLDNGNWAYRYVVVIDGRKQARKRTKNDDGKPFTTEKQAIRARRLALAKEQLNIEPVKKIERKTVEQVFNEYCEKGRTGKAYATVKKQDSLWKNHIKPRFGNVDILDLNTAEIQDYLAELYYVEGRAYGYVESFLKMFYLILGQAYSRGYTDEAFYNKLCRNKDTKIKMPKMKVDEETDIVVFSKEEMDILDNYFSGTNAETAYMLGKHCGIRVNECYGLKWDKIDFEEGTILIDRQMQYQEGLIKLVSLKTRNAKRKIYMSDVLKDYLYELWKRREDISDELYEQRVQNQTTIMDIDGGMISSLALVNCLDNGKIQTVNSMKYHAKKITETCNIHFKYHYLRHTYGTTLANANVPLHILCNQMGHGNSQVTQKYYLGQSEEGISKLKEYLTQL